MSLDAAAVAYPAPTSHPVAVGKPRASARWDAPRIDGPDDLQPVSLEELTLALSHRIGLSEDEVGDDANRIMDIFGFDDRVIDNILEREDRQLFYVLEEEGMLSTDREETVLYDGREWRTHYWQLRKKMIRRFADEYRQETHRRRMASEDDVYRQLPTEAWVTRSF